MQRNEIAKKAYNLFEKHGIDSYPVTIVKLCHNEGIKVFEKRLPPEVSGFIVVQESPFEDYGTGKVIVINSSDCASRKRFTIAHELGHYILHKNGDLYAHRDVGLNTKEEREANYFAGAVLMPKSMLANAISRFGSDAWNELTRDEKSNYISKKFAVSAQAADVRLSILDLI